jgi:uncharacterized membrane protein HdeD (DUF308 family)
VTDEMTAYSGSPDTRSLLISGGIVSIVIGAILLIWPEISVTVLAILLGIDLIVLGVVIVVASLGDDTSVGGKVLGLVLGVLAILAGVAVFGRPLQAVEVIVVVIGIFWVAGGIIEFVLGLFGRAGSSRGIAMLGGALSVIFGIVALSWPGPTVAVLVWLIGIWALVSGAIRLVQGLRAPKPATA